MTLFEVLQARTILLPLEKYIELLKLLGPRPDFISHGY